MGQPRVQCHVPFSSIPMSERSDQPSAKSADCREAPIAPRRGHVRRGLVLRSGIGSAAIADYHLQAFCGFCDLGAGGLDVVGVTAADRPGQKLMDLGSSRVRRPAIRRHGFGCMPRGTHPACCQRSFGNPVARTGFLRVGGQELFGLGARRLVVRGVAGHWES